MKLQRYFKLVLPLLAFILLLNGCAFVNGNKFINMYFDAFTTKNMSIMANYYDIEVETLDEDFNKLIIDDLISRVNSSMIDFEDNEMKLLNEASHQFRADKLNFNVVSVNESDMSVEVDITSTDAFSLLLKELNGVSGDNESYSVAMANSITNALNDASTKNKERITIDLKEEDGKYYIKESSMEKILTIILGVK